MFYDDDERPFTRTEAQRLIIGMVVICVLGLVVMAFVFKRQAEAKSRIPKATEQQPAPSA